MKYIKYFEASNNKLYSKISRIIDIDTSRFINTSESQLKCIRGLFRQNNIRICTYSYNISLYGSFGSFKSSGFYIIYNSNKNSKHNSEWNIIPLEDEWFIMFRTNSVTVDNTIIGEMFHLVDGYDGIKDMINNVCFL